MLVLLPMLLSWLPLLLTSSDPAPTRLPQIRSVLDKCIAKLEATEAKAAEKAAAAEKKAAEKAAEKERKAAEKAAARAARAAELAASRQLKWTVSGAAE